MAKWLYLSWTGFTTSTLLSSTHGHRGKETCLTIATTRTLLLMELMNISLRVTTRTSVSELAMPTGKSETLNGCPLSMGSQRYCTLSLLKIRQSDQICICNSGVESPISNLTSSVLWQRQLQFDKLSGKITEK